MLVGNNYMLYIVMQILHLLPPLNFENIVKTTTPTVQTIFSTRFFSIIFFITDSNYRFSKSPKQTSFCKTLDFFSL